MIAGARPLLVFVSLTLVGGVPARGLAQDTAPDEIEYSVEAPLASRSRYAHEDKQRYGDKCFVAHNAEQAVWKSREQGLGKRSGRNANGGKK